MAEIATVKKEDNSLRGLFARDIVKKRFEDVLGKSAPSFISSVISAYSNTKALQECDPSSIISAAAIAASLNLPINQSLGQAAIVPYGGVATFQIMWRGFVQMAHRTGKYKRMNLAKVYEGQLISYNTFTGEVALDATKKISDKVQGYYFFFELTNGYRHEAYWSATRCIEHGYKYSKSFSSFFKGPWTEDAYIVKGKDGKFDITAFGGFLTDGSGADAMSAKTIIKNELAKWGPLSIEIQEAIIADQAAFKADGTPEYIDSTTVETTPKFEKPTEAVTPESYKATKVHEKKEFANTTKS